ncbi:TPA: hypothetical protein ACNVDX_003678 [Citrobacter gillenii]
MKIEITVISTPPFCPVVDCSECLASCTADSQRAGKIAKAQAAYEEAEKNLRIAEENLRMVVIYG